MLVDCTHSFCNDEWRKQKYSWVLLKKKIMQKSIPNRINKFSLSETNSTINTIWKPSPINLHRQACMYIYINQKIDSVTFFKVYFVDHKYYKHLILKKNGKLYNFREFSKSKCIFHLLCFVFVCLVLFVCLFLCLFNKSVFFVRDIVCGLKISLIIFLLKWLKISVK